MLFFLHPSFYYLLTFFFSVIFLYKWMSTSNAQKSISLPPSPPKLPIIGNLHQLGQFPHRSLQALAQKHGHLMLLRFGSVPVLVASSADAAREIMKTHDHFFSSRPKSTIASKLFYDNKDMAFSPYGEYWRQIRSLSVIHLLSNRRVQSFKRVREEETALMMEKIKHHCSSSSSSSISSVPVNLSQMFVSLTNDVVCRVALGRKYGGSEGHDNKFKKLLGNLVEFLGVFDVGDYIPWLAWWNRINGLYIKVEKLAKLLDEFLDGVIQEHIDQNNRKRIGGGSSTAEHDQLLQQDFVDILLETQRDNTAAFSLDRDSIKALILDMFGAGTDTTLTSLEWTVSELLSHPRIMQKLQNEVRIIAGGKKEISEDDVDNMHYLKAVIKESMRLHPPVPLLVPRQSTHVANVMGYDIPAGTLVIINAWAIQRNPLLWKEAEKFQPERFLGTSIDFKGHDFELIPFGSGRRGCPGTYFATTLNELVLANLVHKFDFALPNGANGEGLNMTETSGMTVHKKDPLLVTVTPYFC